jgi:hypothetical protein
MTRAEGRRVKFRVMDEEGAAAGWSWDIMSASVPAVEGE